MGSEHSLLGGRTFALDRLDAALAGESLMLPVDLLSEVLPEIVRHGVECLPYEAVGMILPDGTIYFLTNEIEELGKYFVSGDQLAAAFMDEDGVYEDGYTLEDVVIWHTHPSNYPGPSRDDIIARRQPLLADVEHMVVALPSGQVAYY